MAQDQPRASVHKAVPFLHVADMQASLRFYVDGLGFVVTNQWVDDGKLRWCLLELDGAGLMLQERQDGWGEVRPGLGVSICLMCDDALAMFHAAARRGLAAVQQPFVGNGLWVVKFADPDGYAIDFESPTDVAEDTVFGAT
jgi:lactoylglutathione lyase